MTVSYCVTLYNKERHIAGVLAAAIAERSETGGEILVYDDASTDGSAAIAERIAGRAPVRLLRGRRNAGVFAATNALLGLASQPYLRIIDGDDEVVPGSTRHLLDILERLDAVLVHGAGAVRGAAAAGPRFPAARSAVETNPLRDCLRTFGYNLSVTLMPGAAVKAILPLPAEFRLAQDLCIALRLAKLGRFAVSEAVVAWSPSETANRLSRRMAAMYRDTCLVLAAELAEGASRADAAFAVRRNALRCRNYFRREAPGCLRPTDRAFLARSAAAVAVESVDRHCERLRRMAALYARDEDRVLA